MAYTEADRAALQAAIASGVLSVSYNGKSVIYRSMDELKAALAEVERSLAAASGVKTHRTIKIYANGKGL